MAFLDVIFPPRCAGCGALLPESRPLCEPCQATLLPAPDPACSSCGMPVEPPALRCARCAADPPPFARAICAFSFAGAMAEAIPRFKYQDRPFLAGPLVELAFPLLETALRSCDVIAPVPLHPQRLRERGFDQALLLARELATRARLPLEARLLERTRATSHQVGASAALRAENLTGAFAARVGAVGGVRVALVDDVITTTATARDAARALREAGVGEVWLFALARAL